MITLEAEFECQKVIVIALQHGLIFRRHREALTFDVLDEYLEYLDRGMSLFATVKYNRHRWVCKDFGLCFTSSSTLEVVFKKANSQYFWEYE
jgi:hypothetical protein